MRVVKEIMNWLFVALLGMMCVSVLSSCDDEYDDTLRAGKSYLKSVQGEDGVVTLPSGLMYKKMYADNETWPKVNGMPTFVYAYYTVRFINGDTLSSHERTIDSLDYDTCKAIDGVTDSIYVADTVYVQPATFGFGYMLSGVQQAVRLMHIGSRWRLWIPSDLAYGSDGSDNVDPNTALIYDFELMGAD